MIPVHVLYSSTGVYVDESEKSIVDEGIEVFSLRDHMNVVSVVVPFYDSLRFALTKHKEGNHPKAVKIYSGLVEGGCQFACFNLGNCYLFGVGVEKDIKKGLELFGKGRGIKNEDLGWMRKLSNDRYVCEKELNLSCLFLSFPPYLILPSSSYME